MWILVAILKWIGLILGGIIGLLLLLLLLVMCVPIRYRLQGSNRHGTTYSFRFSWLLSIVTIKKKADSQKIVLSVFGIPIKRLSGEGEKKKKSKEKKVHRQTEKKSSSVSQGSSAQQTEKQHQKKKQEKKKKNFSFDKLSSIIGLVKDSNNRNVIKRLFREFKQLIKYLSPTKIRGEMVVGTGDPCTTGFVFGGISLIPFAYEDGVHIIPDFEEKRFEADGYVKGKVRVIYFLRMFLRLYHDRELKRLWKQINKVKKEAA